MKLGDWVVYRVFQRKRRPRKQGNLSKSPNTNNIQNTHEMIRSSFMGIRTEPSSPCCSGVTEVSSNGLYEEEISSSVSFSCHSCMKKTWNMSLLRKFNCIWELCNKLNLEREKKRKKFNSLSRAIKQIHGN